MYFCISLFDSINPEKMYIRIFLLLILFFLFKSTAIAQNFQTSNYQFRHLTLDNGLSHADANIVVQDKKGFIWIGTYSGLNRYDGYTVKAYYNELSYINKPYLNRIHDISVNKDGFLWLATSAGIQFFDPYKECFVPIEVKNEIYRDEEYDLEKILSVDDKHLLVKNNDNRITMYRIENDYTLVREPLHIDALCFSVYKDADQRIWVSTDKGIYVFRENNVWYHFFLPKENGKNVSVRLTFINKKNELLIATENDLYLFQHDVNLLFDRSDKELKNGIRLPVDLSKGWITDLIQDRNDEYWISSLKGLYHIFVKDGQFVSESIYTGSSNNNLTSDFISRLLLDKSDNLFVSTYGGGVNILDINRNNFHLIQKQIFGSNSISENIVRAITESPEYLWFGTNSTGLNRMNKKTGQFFYYNTHSEKSTRLLSDGIRALLNENDTTLWVGHTEGLDLIDLSSGKVQTTFAVENTAFGEVTSIVRDCFGQIWIGTWNKGLGRIRKNEKGHYDAVLFKNEKPDYPAFTPSRIITVYADSIRPELFYSSGKQLIRLFLDKDGEIEKSLIYQANDAKVNSLSSNFVCSIVRENDSILWLGCIGGGLNRMLLLANGDYRSEALKDQNRLEQMDIESLQMDSNGDLWLGTNGLIKYTPDKNKFNFYKTIDGSSVNSFKVGGSYQTHDGWLYFGGIKGVVYFNPQNIKINQFKANPEIASVLINNQDYPVTENLILPYNKNSITLYFTGMHYSAPEKCKYKYRLLPFEKQWRYSENGLNMVNYANLPYGNYSFELLASNNDGIWNDSLCKYIFKINPPWWLSLYMKIIYFILALALLSGVYIYLLYWFNLKKQLEIKQIKELQNERIHQMQLQFFTNISHEFRTPLTLISGAIEKMSMLSGEKETYQDLLMRNIKRLMNLVDGLIDFRKVETEGFKLAVQEQDLYPFLEKILSDFKLLADSKNINFKICIPNSIRRVWFDPEIIERIVLNLLNNAFKYTKQGGEIIVAVDSSVYTSSFEYQYKIENEKKPEAGFTIYIKDNGVGISNESIAKIFTRYYRIQDSEYDPHLGSGIGLALVKSFLVVHNGSLLVSSKRGEGTDFLLTFPCSEKDYKEEDRYIAEGCDLKKNVIFDDQLTSLSLPEKSVHDEFDKVAHTNLLLVEDNDEVRNLLVQSLSDSYKVWSATDGEEALSMIKQHIPDIIISDWMMPNMNGYELCKIVKESNEYQSIPFIMLTAKTSLESHIESANIGADAYLVKPVSLKLLSAVIRNLLIQRKRLKDTSSSAYLQDLFNETVRIKDSAFYNTFIELIISNLSNPDLDVNMIAQKMGLSRTSLYQKVKEITEKPVMELVRQLRLRKAVQLMVEENLPISEIIPQIGIMSQSYFTNAFKKEYGMTPTQYMKDLKKTNS